MLKDQLVKLRNKLFGVNAILAAIEEYKSEISSNKVEKLKVEISSNKSLKVIDTKIEKSLVPSQEMNFIGIGDGDYELVGNEFFNYFVNQGGLKPNDKVLEVGCGSGRMSRPLANYLSSSQGEYKGFDIVKMGIDWCKEAYAVQYPNFSFTVADVHNKHYNPTGKYEAKNYQFIYQDSYFDFVFLTSVFTHMFPLDMENYIKEIARVLKPGGTCLISFFLINSEATKLMETNAAFLNFSKEIEQGCFTVNEADPEAAIAYDEKLIREIYKKYNLEIKEPIYHGGWCGRKDFLSYQDIIIAKKALQPIENKEIENHLTSLNLEIPSQISDRDEMLEGNKEIENHLTSLNLEIPSQISDRDEMLEGNVKHYFRVTKSALDIISNISKDILPQVNYILDLPSGHGRVCRGLRYLFPDATIVACDLNTDGVDFCATHFNAVKVYSSEDLGKIEFPCKFDLIWCGSLITHLNKERSSELLKLFVNNLTNEGVLIISSVSNTGFKRIINDNCTYGLDKSQLYNLIDDYYRLGYGYSDYPNGQGYGISLIDKSWLEMMGETIGFELIDYQEAAWDHHHDISIIKKIKQD